MRSLITILFSVVWAERAPHSGATGVAFVQSATNLARSLQLTEEEDTPDLEHMHLVCHRHGCKEVQATLDVIKAAKAEAQAGLDQCAKDRAALSAKLGKISKERAKVEVDLASCAADRADLEEKLAECGKHRAEVEAGLAKCAVERAALEAELKQCAEVDRPAAEKALAECGVARAKLEKKLKELEEKLKSGAATRRRSSRRRSSLIETNASDTEVDSEEASLLAEISLTKQQLFEQKVRQNNLEQEYDEYSNKVDSTVTLIHDSDNKTDVVTAKLLSNAEQIKETNNKLEVSNQEQAQILNASRLLDQDLATTISDMKDLSIQESELQSKQAESTILLAKTQKQFLSLIMKDQDEEEMHLSQKHKRSSDELAQKRALLGKKEEANEECDDLRVEVITLAASVKNIEKKLAKCLATKKDLNEKIAAAEEATALARAGLQKCNKNKASLTAALTECGEKCAQTETLLNECLERKKVLKKKIDECHTARDLANSKLKECLEKKEELGRKIADLQEKIDAMGLLQDVSSSNDELTLSSAVQSILNVMKDISLAEKTALRESAVATAGLQGVVDASVAVGAYAEAAGKNLHAGINAAKQAQSNSNDVGQNIEDSTQKLQQAGCNVKQAGAQANRDVQVAGR